MPSVTINLPQKVIERFESMGAGPVEPKMAKALKEIAFEWEKDQSRGNIQSANRAAQAQENTRLTNVKGELEL